MRKMLFTVSSSLALLAVPAFGQTAVGTQPVTGTSTTGTATTRPGPTEVVPAGTVRISDITRASRILGRNVYNRADENIGDIEELIVDPKSGQIQQVVIGIGGFLGIGEKLIAIPFDQLKVEEVKVTLPATEAARTPPPAAMGTAPSGAAAPGSSTAAAPAGSAAGSPTTTDTRPAGSAATTPAAEPIMRARFMVEMTKDQAKAAPEYKYERR